MPMPLVLLPLLGKGKAPDPPPRLHEQRVAEAVAQGQVFLAWKMPFLAFKRTWL